MLDAGGGQLQLDELLAVLMAGVIPAPLVDGAVGSPVHAPVELVPDCGCWVALEPDKVADNGAGAAKVELAVESELPTEACVPARAVGAEMDVAEVDCAEEPDKVQLALVCRSKAASGIAYTQLDLLRSGPESASSTGAAAAEL